MRVVAVTATWVAPLWVSVDICFSEACFAVEADDGAVGTEGPWVYHHFFFHVAPLFWCAHSIHHRRLCQLHLKLLSVKDNVNFKNSNQTYKRDEHMFD